MAAHGWGKSASVEEWLLAEAHRFDFYQAVALLEAIFDLARTETERRGHLPSVGEGTEPGKEAIRFKSSISLAFPETDVDSVQHPEQGDRKRYAMKVNFMSLAGAVGPLPPPFAELIVQRSARHDVAAREFLDIFNHRLVSIAYRIRKRHRIGLGAASPLHDDTARQLFSLMGLGPSIFGEEVPERYRPLLHYAGMFARETRSMAGLESILRYHFGVPIEGVQFTGRFCKLDSEELTSIGPSGKNRTLGRDALIGSRVWDQTASFEIRVGPLSFEELLRFRPPAKGNPEVEGDAIRPLCELVRFYAGDTFDFSLCLILKPQQVPATFLSAKRSPEGRPGAVMVPDNNVLGFSAWIGAGRRSHEPMEVRLSPEVVSRVLKPRTAPPPGAPGQGGVGQTKDGARRGAAV